VAEETSPIPVIVITAFGTNSAAGQKDLENVDRLVMARYPDHEVRWVFTSGFIRKKLISLGQTTLFERQVPIKSLEEVYADLRKEGKRNVALQCLLTMTGSEYSDALMVAADDLNVEYGYPLLAPPDNVARTADALAPKFNDEDTVTIICSHGNPKVFAFNVPLIQLDKYLRKHYQNVFLTTLDGPPGTEPAFADARKSGLPKVKFIPFLIVGGGHLSEDIMGDDPESYRNQLGLPATAESGLGNNPAVMSIWMESLDWTLAKFSG
jgi:sirohydrochlorin cobaltochelatase